MKDEKQEREAKGRRKAVNAIVSRQEVLGEDDEFFEPSQLTRVDGTSITTAHDGASRMTVAVITERLPIPIKMV